MSAVLAHKHAKRLIVGTDASHWLETMIWDGGRFYFDAVWQHVFYHFLTQKIKIVSRFCANFALFVALSLNNDRQ